MKLAIMFLCIGSYVFSQDFYELNNRDVELLPAQKYKEAISIFGERVSVNPAVSEIVTNQTVALFSLRK
jgi:hypothetical protein